MAINPEILEKKRIVRKLEDEQRSLLEEKKQLEAMKKQASRVRLVIEQTRNKRA